ncbi:MAG: phosphoribosylanthranilate isomerase [Porticoccaceae bacterium]|jgi:phosphoribosylanthranilate isomerase|nr:phosphoribosylanthranilate isomerase [Porticoccaceae bacterium]
MSVQVKICGITNVEQALMAQRAGADALGLVIYSKSSRYVSIEQAAEIRSAIEPQTLAVALLVNADADFVKRVINEVRPDLLQFHGDESPAFCQQFSFPFIRAIRMREGLDLNAEVAAYNADGGFLFDAWSDDQYGGTGHQFDWSRLPQEREFKLILAGGLRPDNITQAVIQVQPDMVDVSGGVELSAGVKDPQKVATFIANAKQALIV